MSDTGLLPGYLIVGSDELKSSHAVERMRSRLEKTGMAEFNLDERDMAKDPQIDDIIASLNTFPMGAEFRLVILTNCDKLPKAVSEPLVEYFSNPSPTTVCLVVATSLAKNTRLYKAIKKLGAKAIIECAPKKTWEMPPQVVKMAAAHGKSMGIPAAEALAARSGENTRMLDNELKKLASMVEGPEIDLGGRRAPCHADGGGQALGVFERRGGSRPCASAPSCSHCSRPRARCVYGRCWSRACAS